jgi:hypothetical protein
MAAPSGRAVRFIFSFLRKKEKDIAPIPAAANIFHNAIHFQYSIFFLQEKTNKTQITMQYNTIFDCHP